MTKKRKAKVREELKSRLRVINPDAPEPAFRESFENKLSRIKKSSELYKGLKDLWQTMTDHGITGWKRASALSALVYFVMPGDVIPDLTPYLGYLDDAVIVSATLAFITRGKRCEEVQPDALLDKAIQIKRKVEPTPAIESQIPEVAEDLLDEAEEDEDEYDEDEGPEEYRSPYLDEIYD